MRLCRTCPCQRQAADGFLYTLCVGLYPSGSNGSFRSASCTLLRRAFAHRSGVSIAASLSGRLTPFAVIANFASYNCFAVCLNRHASDLSACHLPTSSAFGLHRESAFPQSSPLSQVSCQRTTKPYGLRPVGLSRARLAAHLRVIQVLRSFTPRCPERNTNSGECKQKSFGVANCGFSQEIRRKLRTHYAQEVFNAQGGVVLRRRRDGGRSCYARDGG